MEQNIRDTSPCTIFEYSTMKEEERTHDRAEQRDSSFCKCSKGTFVHTNNRNAIHSSQRAHIQRMPTFPSRGILSNNNITSTHKLLLRGHGLCTATEGMSRGLGDY